VADPAGGRSAVRGKAPASLLGRRRVCQSDARGAAARKQPAGNSVLRRNRCCCNVCGRATVASGNGGMDHVRRGHGRPARAQRHSPDPACLRHTCIAVDGWHARLRGNHSQACCRYRPACRRDPGDWWIDLDRHGRRAAVRDGCIAKSGRRWWADAGEGHRHRMRPGKRSGRFADDDRPQSRRRHNDLGAAAFRTFSGVGGRAPSRVRLQWCPSAEPAQAEPDRTRWGSDLVWTDLEVPRPRSRPD
jgi:hypothetical protein